MHNSGYQIKKLVQLALPVFAAQVAQTLMGFIDTVMAGQVSAVDMAAVAVGTSIWLPVILLFSGVIWAVPPLVSHLHGAKQEAAVRPLIHQAFYLALICALIAMGVLSQGDSLLAPLALDPELERLSVGYMEAILWGAPAFLLFQVLRSFNEGLSFTPPSMVISFVGLAINIPANYIFINGHFGMPAMGGAGCGVATAIVYWGMALTMGLYLLLSRRFRAYQLFRDFRALSWQAQRQIWALGLPIAAAVFFEVTMFTGVAIMIAPLGPVVVAGHQVAANFSTIIYMLPLSIGVAVTIRVGYYLGREEPKLARMVAKIGVLFGIAVSLFTAILTVLLRHPIADLYSNDAGVIEVALHLMLLCALYQISDAIQVVTTACLRGYKDTMPILWIALISFWGVGFTSGYVLGSTDWVVAAMGAQGYWIGFISGLSCAALLLHLRLKQVQTRYEPSATA
ncbi:MATE family efflux transporter [Ferrimonas gelatinilytica]|uniref:Multidrug-efflux transporter n=1 Tax=Ferrimonas gelatinilytica TaxID=1255257 RepID=A0ABP9RXD0_9GAMM